MAQGSGTRAGDVEAAEIAIALHLDSAWCHSVEFLTMEYDQRSRHSHRHQDRAEAAPTRPDLCTSCRPEVSDLPSRLKAGRGTR